MKGTKVAVRYAKALLEISIENKSIDSVLSDMQSLSKTINENHEFELLIASPIVNSSKKLEIFEKVFNSFEKISMSFIRLITKNGREVFLPLIAESFAAQVNELRGIIPMTLTSAIALDETTKKQIIAKVQEAVDGQLEIEEKIDESLIGGFVVRMGDTQIDASVLSQFNNLKQRLTR